MSKHTPGPWNYVAPTEHHGAYVTSEFGNTICDCYTMDRSGLIPIDYMLEMSHHNARLIAVAPELLEALKEARETILDLAHARWSEVEATDEQLVGGYEALIAKAEGR